VILVAGALVVAAAEVVTAGAAVAEPPIGAVVVPSISDWTEALKEPVMPVMVNFAEKPRAGN